VKKRLFKKEGIKMKKVLFLSLVLVVSFMFVGCVPNEIDTDGDSNSGSNPAPLEIIEERVETENVYGIITKKFYVVTKNTTEKTVIAYKVNIVGYNAFDEQVDIDFYDSLNGIVQDVEINPGETYGNNSYWDSVYADAVSYIEAKITEVRFKDGSKWEN
jgi:hypothetical protein